MRANVAEGPEFVLGGVLDILLRSTTFQAFTCAYATFPAVCCCRLFVLLVDAASERRAVNIMLILKGKESAG